MALDQYSPTGFRVLPPVVKNIIIINILFFLATIGLGSATHIDLTEILGLRYFASSKFEPYQFITYMFMHGGFSHIFFNMFALWMFGSVLENVWGPKRFILFYFITGIGAALTHYLVFYLQINPVLNLMDTFINNPDFANLQHFVSNHKFVINDSSGELFTFFGQFESSYQTLREDPTNAQALQVALTFVTEYRDHFLNIPVVIGASGAIFGLLLAFGMLFPNSLIYLYFFIPIKAKWFVIVFGLIELVSGFMDTGGNVAHFAHLGGMAFGFFLIIYWSQKDKRRRKNYWE
ncbi:MAG: rhomboid family intramembrane serine protease [Bacteroidetes bacterium]|nr:rhomboid family intramembrane serine protease [Bacteroidota bacterium]